MISGLDDPGIEFRWVEIFRALILCNWDMTIVHDDMKKYTSTVSELIWGDWRKPWSMLTRGVELRTEHRANKIASVCL
jgi:hypothetical protein